MNDSIMKRCTLCARACRTDRTKRAGRCGGTDQVLAARAALHMWEEPCISGKEGSGTVFFVGCPLGCVFCQNRSIALGRHTGADGWRILTSAELAGVFLSLEAKQANNINLVTPTHFVPQIIEAVRIARSEGLSIPVVYNTGSYETPETIRALRDTVDIFLPDLKFQDPAVAARYADAPDYFEVAVRAIDEMVAIAGREEASFDERGMMTRGVIVRHMILPGHTKDSMRILRTLHERYGDRIWVSILNQYTPMPGIESVCPELNRKVTRREYDRVLDFAIRIGIRNAYMQEGPTASESFIPSFRGEGLTEGEGGMRNG
ncbi:MAG: radical SAM protein [Clostridiales bacterium]|nr:radical SAM protein [Clostridiales bacterium]